MHRGLPASEERKEDDEELSEFETHLDQLLGGVHAVRMTVLGYMSLSVEEIGFTDDEHRLVSLCHYGEQNGDLMRDPDIVFLFHNLPDEAAAEPVSFLNDYHASSHCSEYPDAEGRWATDRMPEGRGGAVSTFSFFFRARSP